MEVEKALQTLMLAAKRKDSARVFELGRTGAVYLGRRFVGREVERYFIETEEVEAVLLVYRKNRKKKVIES